MSTSEQQGFMDRHHFVLRRLHSLCGIVPVGAFLFPHLTTNSSIMWGSWIGKSHVANGHAGVETFQHEVNFIHSLPALILIEIFVLWLPIAFHALYGVHLAVSGKPNVSAYRYGPNWRYTLQRLTGYLGVLFIFMHISSLRWGWGWFGLFPTDFVGTHAASTTAAHFQDGDMLRTILVSAFYLFAVLGLVFHFANGLWTAAITWGLTTTVGAQKRWGMVCAAVGAGLCGATVLSVVGFNTVSVDEAYTVETQMLMGADAAHDDATEDADNAHDDDDDGDGDDH